eukprot:6348042-Amphidinium_carterae.1
MSLPVAVSEESFFQDSIAQAHCKALTVSTMSSVAPKLSQSEVGKQADPVNGCLNLIILAWRLYVVSLNTDAALNLGAFCVTLSVAAAAHHSVLVANLVMVGQCGWTVTSKMP